MDIFKVAKKFPLGPRRGLKDNDYFSDRLSHRYTTQIIILFIILATFKRLFQSPITCWVPAELKRYEKYINRYCWIKGTYYVNQSYDLNTLTIEARNESLLHYYQWVYLFLMFQALLFYLPRILWCFISHKLLGYDLFNIIDAGMQYEKSDKQPDLILKYLDSNITSTFKHIPIKLLTRAYLFSKNDEQRKKELDNQPSFFLDAYRQIKAKISNSVLTLTYILIKILYMFVALFQLYMMNTFLSNKSYTIYGKIFKI